jgi:hypothetical protein
LTSRCNGGWLYDFYHHKSLNIIDIKTILILSYFLVFSLDRKTLEVITGNMLGDGNIRYPNFTRDGKITGNPRYSMIMGLKVYNYLK